MLPDLHMHTCYSHDGAPHSTVAALCEQAIALGLPCIAVTDHYDLNHELAVPPTRSLQRRKIYEDVLAAREIYGDKLTLLHGIELGQRKFRDGEEFFHKYARFTPDRLAFYDANGNQVAYISDRKLYIANVHITGTFLKGRFEDTVQADGSIVTRWI